MMLCSLPMAAPVEAAACDPDGGFLGFKPWYSNLCKGGGGKDKNDIATPNKSDSNAIPVFVWTIILNIVFDISLAVGYLTLAMVVYGGYLYIMSQGDPGKLAGAKKTLTSAAIGTVIAMGATVIVNTLSFVLIGSGLVNGGGVNDLNRNSIGEEDVNRILNWAYAAAGIVAVVFIIKGGFDYMLSRGDPSKTHKGTQTLIFSVVGLVIVVLAAIITNFLLSSAGGAL